MPEHHSGPETDDLDATFRELVDDVGSRSHRPGADRAVRTAGERRRAFASGALVLVLVVAAGVGGWALLGSRRVGVPVAGPGTTFAASPVTPTDGDVPAPAPLTVDRLNAASAGWTTWRKGTAVGADVPRCLTRPVTGPEPSGTTTEHYRAGASAVASLERLRFVSRADSNTVMLATVTAFDACPANTGLYNQDVSADLEVVAFTWGTGDRRGTVWLVNFDNRMDVFSVAGTPRTPEDAFGTVSRLVAADVQVP